MVKEIGYRSFYYVFILLLVVPLVVFLCFYSVLSLGYLLALYAFVYFASWFFFKDPFSPFIFLNLFVFFYSVSFPFLIFISNISDPLVLGKSKIIVLSGLVVFLSSFFVSMIHEFPFFKGRPLLKLDASNFSIWLLFFLGFFVFFLAVQEILSSNATAKYELATSGFISVLMYFFVCYAFLISSKKRSVIFFAFVLLVFFFYYLVSGERDYLVRICLMILAYQFYCNRVSSISVFLAYVLGFLVLPLSQALKGYFSYGGGQVDYSFNSLFSGEFLSQGRNFYWMLQYKEKMEAVYDNIILNDFLRFLKLVETSSGSIFGTEVLGRTGGSGVGFSIPGALHFIGGYSAIFIFGFLVNMALFFFYVRFRKDSSIQIYFYITMMFAVSYGLRADFANLLAGVFKVGLFPIIFLIFVDRLIKVLSWKG